MLVRDQGTKAATVGSTRLSFAEAVNAALRQAMELDSSVFVYGIGADGRAGIFGTTSGLVERFGQERVFDTPIAEAGLTALAAAAGTPRLPPGPVAST